jgi:hypothetical protein
MDLECENAGLAVRLWLGRFGLSIKGINGVFEPELLVKKYKRAKKKTRTKVKFKTY